MASRQRPAKQHGNYARCRHWPCECCLKAGLGGTCSDLHSTMLLTSLSVYGKTILSFHGRIHQFLTLSTLRSMDRVAECKIRTSF